MTTVPPRDHYLGCAALENAKTRQMGACSSTIPRLCLRLAVYSRTCQATSSHFVSLSLCPCISQHKRSPERWGTGGWGVGGRARHARYCQRSGSPRGRKTGWGMQSPLIVHFWRCRRAWEAYPRRPERWRQPQCYGLLGLCAFVGGILFGMQVYQARLISHFLGFPTCSSVVRTGGPLYG